MSLRSRSHVKASMVLTRADHLFIHNYILTNIIELKCLSHETYPPHFLNFIFFIATSHTHPKIVHILLLQILNSNRSVDETCNLRCKFITFIILFYFYFINISIIIIMRTTIIIINVYILHKYSYITFLLLF